jgi:hypothetical protein
MLFRFLLNVKVTEFNKSCPNISSEFFSNNKVISSETHTFSRVTIRLLNSRTVNVKFLTFFLECTYGDIQFQLPVHKI